MPPIKQVYQFKITLQGIKPPIWRRIQVPSTYTFYDLHVAIQDAMGWLDYHLHEFRVQAKTGETLVFGIPSEDGSFMLANDRILAGWRHKMSKYETIISRSFMYTYDYGDDWTHKIDFEETRMRF
ncbi:plasmid pRiA4b ORF-3 family protein [Geomonas nitrogeniifigens]|uniref:Plasmid pRiA4b ORF-3 family protein n=1 Tax=Geomonas diazotrophica TaxID=2843197 RepID=A0ABX8JM65_9BACT|nr:plasmid pRiA4b ORF-3 family protein [Geomonas nitrogeniifigens]QWV98642.1 plasmid pRiA4b ORF-3 family protein [Geomonas nitrogeniifigens]